MKKLNTVKEKRNNYLLRLFKCFFAVVVFLPLATDCSDSDEPDINQFDIIGTWVIKSMAFNDMVDLDGHGPRQPTNDAKSVFYDIFGFYDNCSSIGDIPIQFTNEQSPMISSHLKANAICQQGNGITSEVFAYLLRPTIDESEKVLHITKNEILDPGGLIDWSDALLFLLMDTDDYNCNNGICTISGYSENFKSALPEPKPDINFTFVLEKVE